MSARKNAIVRGLFAAVALAPAVAPAAELRYGAPASCDRERTLREDVERLIGAPLESVAGLEFDVQVTTQNERAWALRLSTSDPVSREPRVRELTGSSCADVTNAAAVAIALAVENAEHQPVVASDPEPLPVPPPAAPPPPEHDRAAEPRRTESTRSSPTRFTLAGGLVADAGALPSLAPGAQVELGLHLSGWRFSALGAAFAEQHASISEGRGGDFRLLLGAVLVCREGPVARLSLVACAGYEAGELEGEGTGVQSKLGSALWQAARLDAGVGYALGGSFGLEFRAGAALPVARRAFAVDGDTLVHRPASLTARAYLGVSVAL